MPAALADPAAALPDSDNQNDAMVRNGSGLNQSSLMSADFKALAALYPRIPSSRRRRTPYPPIVTPPGNQTMSQDSPYRRLRDLAVEEQPLSVSIGSVPPYGPPRTVGPAAGLCADLGSDLLCHFGSLHRLARAPRSRLMQRHGIGRSQAARLHAVAELARRLQAPPRMSANASTVRPMQPICSCRRCVTCSRSTSARFCSTRATGARY